MSVLIASDPYDALVVCGEHRGPIDVLFTDVVMPGMSGRDLAERARAMRPEIEVVYTSGYSDDVVLARGPFEPGTAFLAKPFTSEDLLATIREALSKRKGFAWA
jgi:CheY-like chemotaxis protein